MSSRKALILKIIIKKWNIPFIRVKCRQSYVPLCGVATFGEVGITEGFSNFLNITALRYITNSIVCKNQHSALCSAVQPFMWHRSSCWHQHHTTEISEKCGEEAEPVSRMGQRLPAVLIWTWINQMWRIWWWFVLRKYNDFNIKSRCAADILQCIYV